MAQDSSKTPPITHEQLDFFSEQTERVAIKASNEAVRNYRNRALVGFASLVLGLGLVFHTQGQDRQDNRAAANAQRVAIVKSGQAVAVDGCNRSFLDRAALRNVLLAGRASIPASLKRGDITQQQAQFALEFYGDQLSRLPLPDCRHTRGLLTADPDKVPAIPTPLHPADSPLAAHDSIFTG